MPEPRRHLAGGRALLAESKKGERGRSAGGGAAERAGGGGGVCLPAKHMHLPLAAREAASWGGRAGGAAAAGGGIAPRSAAGGGSAGIHRARIGGRAQLGSPGVLREIAVWRRRRRRVSVASVRACA